MSTNPTVSALLACLAPIVAAAVVLFKLNLTQDQQAELVTGLAAVLTLGATIFASVVHHSNAKVNVADRNLAAVQIANAPADQVDKAS